MDRGDEGEQLVHIDDLDLNTFLFIMTIIVDFYVFVNYIHDSLLSPESITKRLIVTRVCW